MRNREFDVLETCIRLFATNLHNVFAAYALIWLPRFMNELIY